MLSLSSLINPVLNDKIGNFTSSVASQTALSLLLQNLITLAFGIAGLVLLLMIIIGGYEFLTAGGDKEATEKAKKRLTNAVIGIIILFSVFAILAVVGNFFGLNLTTIFIPSFDVTSPPAAPPPTGGPIIYPTLQPI